VLRKHFDPNVNLVCVAEKIQPNAFEPHAKSAYAGCFDFGKSQKAKLGGPSRPSRVINKEINLVQTDDNEDDAENFEVRPKDESELKKESGLSEETTMELARELYGTPREKRPDTKNSVHGGNVEPKTRSVIDPLSTRSKSSESASRRLRVDPPTISQCKLDTRTCLGAESPIQFANKSSMSSTSRPLACPHALSKASTRATIPD
jgi:hypothetical protein